MTKVLLARTETLTALLTLLFVVIGAETGCVVETVNAPPTGVAVSAPPPPPMKEVRPAATSANSLWVAGYWHWTGMQYTWIPGHWEDALPGARWRAPNYSL